MKYRLYATLPRTESRLLIFEGSDLEQAHKQCNKNIKYFPKLTLTHGGKSFPGYQEEVYENSEFVDRGRDTTVDIRIGKIKKRSGFEHRVIYENENKVCFLIRYKMNQARVCIIDAEDKEKVFGLLKYKSSCYRIKIHRSALPLVYYRHNAIHHTTLMELIFNKKKFGYATFKDGNPYNYMKSNVIFTKVAITRNKKKPATGYYGVLYRPTDICSKKYLVHIHVDGKHKKIGRYADALTAAKNYDRARMEVYGRSAAKNFSYEYYAAFEPFYVLNVS